MIIPYSGAGADPKFHRFSQVSGHARRADKLYEGKVDEEEEIGMTVDQLKLLPPSISGVRMSPSAQTAGVQLGTSKGYGTTPSTDISFSKEAMALYTSYLGGPDGPNGAN